MPTKPKTFLKKNGRALLILLFAVAATLLFSCERPGVPAEPVPDYYFARGENREFVPTGHYPEDDLVIGSKNIISFGAVADGVTDDSPALQKAINAVSSAGGGVVYIPAGVYYLSDQITIPEAVTLCGDWISPEKEPAGTRGTVIITDYKGRTLQPQFAFIRMGGSSGLRNLTIYHSNQDPEKPVKMAPTVGCLTCSQPSLENLTFVNSYTAISFGEGKGTNCSLAGFVNLYITALSQGAVLNNSMDVSRFENVHVSPEYWADNVISPLSDEQKNSLYEYCFKNCTGITLYRGDATGLYGTTLKYCRTGILLENDPNGNGVTSGAITLTKIFNCDIGIAVNGAHGIGTAINGFAADADRKCSAAIKTGNGYQNNVKVEDGKICGKYVNAAIVMDKASLSFTSVEFDTASSEYAITARAGIVTCVGCSFKNKNVFSDANSGSSAGYFYGCEMPFGASAKKTSGSVFVTKNDKIEINEPSAYHVYRESLPMPASMRIVSITEFGAVSDGVTDCTEAIQAALDHVSSLGGGIALIPAGRFALKGCVTVPTGCELSGVLGVWSYSATVLKSSCLLLYGGKDKPGGQAAISLEKGSGIRGFIAWYPEQDYDNYVKYSFAVRSLGPDTYAINVNICNAYQYMDFATNDSTGHYIRNCSGIAIRTGLYVGNNSGDGWIENVHLNQHQPYELYRRGESGGYDPARFTELVFGKFIKETVYYVFGYNENEHVLGAFGLGAIAVYRFTDQNGKTTSGTFVQCGADGCTTSFLIEQAGKLDIIAPGTVSLGDALTRTYFTTGSKFEGELSIYGGAGFGSPSNCIVIQGGTVNLNTFTFASANKAIPLMLAGGKEVNLVNCVVPFSGAEAKSKIMLKFKGKSTETGTVIMQGKYGYEPFATLVD